MNLKNWNLIKLENLFDKCKNCGCTSFECRHCKFREFYRHIDDKTKMKSNMKIIRNLNIILFDKNGKILSQKINYKINHDDYTKAMILEMKEWYLNKNSN